MARVLALALMLLACRTAAEAKVVIGDDLSDVVDSEEDDEWRNWAPKSRYDDPTKKAAAFAMIKLQYKPDRNIEEVRFIADKWTDKLQTGHATVRFKPIDPNTLFVNLRQDDELENVKQFVLEQPETYEVMIDGRTFRRDGDPSVEEAGEDIERAVKRRLKREKMMKARMKREAARREKEEAKKAAKKEDNAQMDGGVAEGSKDEL